MVEPLALLVLPGPLEGYEFESHARQLLEIPRVLAIEPRRPEVSPLISEAASMGQAKRLRLPGRPRLVLLYGPHQYPLARAIVQRNPNTELWYLDLETSAEVVRIEDFDRLARRDANRVISPEATTDTDALRERLTELGVINARPFARDPRQARTRKAKTGKARFGFR